MIDSNTVYMVRVKTPQKGDYILGGPTVKAEYEIFTFTDRNTQLVYPVAIGEIQLDAEGDIVYHYY